MSKLRERSYYWNERQNTSDASQSAVRDGFDEVRKDVNALNERLSHIEELLSQRKKGRER